MSSFLFSFFRKNGKPLACALLLLLLLGCGGYLLFHHLDFHAITLYDESRHGINAYEMDLSGDMVVSTYLGETDYYNLKPPLSLWGIIAGYKLFGYNPLGLRAYSAVAAFLSMVCLALWVKRRYGWKACLPAMLLYIGCDFLYVGHMARFGDADGLYLLFFTVGMLCMLNSGKTLRWLYGSALCFGFGFMTKSWHAAMIPVICFVYLCVTGQLKRLRPRHYLALLFFGLLPVLPWAVLRMQRDGLAFFMQTFTTDVQERMAFSGHSPALYYFYTLFHFSGSIYSLALCLMGAGLSLWQKRRPTATEKGLFLWFFLPVFLYSFSGFRVYWYILPIIPALSVAGALALRKLWALAKGKPLLLALCAVLSLGAIAQLGCQFHQVNRITNTNGYQRTMDILLDREYDSGRRAYIQYDDVQTGWMDSDRLRAMLTGDVVCVNGGQEAFAREEESALLFINRWHVSPETLEYFPVLLENGEVWVLENLN